MAEYLLDRSKTTYVPYMCDHAPALAAALEAHGYRAMVMAEPDDGSAALGLGSVLGRECSPCAIVVGDILRCARQPDFDPSRSAFLLATAGGPCRFSQYHVLLRRILAEQGLGSVSIVCPTAANGYSGFAPDWVAVRKLIWDGVVAVDLLQQLLHTYRPYARQREAADAIYDEALTNVLNSVRAGGKGLAQAIRVCAERIAALDSDRSRPRPVIGLVGEIYVRFNAHANRAVIRKIEALGGEVRLASMMEWIYYVNYHSADNARTEHAYWRWASVQLTDLYQRYREWRLTRGVAHYLRHPYEGRIAPLLENLKPYYEPLASTEAVMSLGKAIEYAHEGADGIVNVMPFSCMPGIITAGMAPRVRAELDNIPWLDLSYDMQKTTNMDTRLEAFMYQATHFQQRRREHGAEHSTARHSAADIESRRRATS